MYVCEIYHIYHRIELQTCPNQMNVQITNVADMVRFILDRLKNLMGKGENASY